MRLSPPFPRAQLRADGSRRPLLRQRWLLLPIAIIVLVALGLWWLSTRLATPAAVTTASVSQGNLTLTVTGSGTIAAARTVDLAFPQAGTVSSVSVNVGDQVKAGQTLATIDAGDLQLQLEQAQASLKAAEAKRDQTANGSTTPQEQAIAQAALASAKAGLDKTKTGTATKADIQSAQAQLAAAQAKLAALKNPTAAALSSAQIKLQQAQATAQNTRDSDSQAKTNAQLQLQNAVNALTQAQSKFSTANNNWQYVQDSGNDPIQPTKTGSDGKATDNKLNDAQRQQYADAFVQAQAALQSAQNAVAQAQLTYDTARQKEATDVAQADAAVADSQTQLNALQNPSASDITQAQAAVTQAQANLTKLTQGGTADDITQAQSQVTQAQANLDKLSAPAATADIASADASVLQAQVQVKAAQRNLDQATLTAPFDGVVSAVAVQQGATASTSKAAVTLIDRSKLHIDVSLSESDAAKVKIGQPVTLTFDAAPTTTLNGKIATIAPASTVQQNVVTYPVSIEFDAGSSPIKVGMSATAEIQVQQINNAILVPSRAVQTTGTTKAVTVLQGDQKIPVTVQVETGATSNGQTQITSCVDTGAQCLQAGDVLQISTTTTSTRTQTNRTGLGIGGLGGGTTPRGP